MPLPTWDSENITMHDFASANASGVLVGPEVAFLNQTRNKENLSQEDYIEIRRLWDKVNEAIRWDPNR